MNEPKLKAGRPPRPDRENVKRNRTLSFTDKEYERLGMKAKYANMTKSEYIVENLDL